MGNKIKQDINWLDSGLNFDDDPRVLGVGDSTDRVNVTTNELGREFVISNMKGTVKKSHTFTHDAAYNAAVYTAIGSVYDDNRDAVYTFIYSTAGNDSILRYNFSDDSFDKIAWDHTNLGLDPAYPITDGYMIGDFLHFNPRTSSPRVINVQWAYWDFVAYEISRPTTDSDDWNVGDYVKENNKVYLINETVSRRDDILLIDDPEKVTFIDWTYQDVDTYPPSATNGEYKAYRFFYNTSGATANRPFANLLSDTAADANYIRNNIFQFTYRFHVPGHGFTTAAPFSDMVVNENDESLTGEAIEEVTTNNYIRVGFPVEDVYQNSGIWLFEFVQILFRKNDEEDWRIADTIYHDDAANYATLPITIGGSTQYVCGTDFYNDKAYPIADSASIEKPFNALPVTARAQWNLDGERTGYGGIVEGYDPPPGGVIVSLTPSYREIILKGTLGAVDTTYTFTEVQSEINLSEGIGYYIQYAYTSDAITPLPISGANYIQFTIDSNVYSGIYDGAVLAEFQTAVLDVVNQSSVGAYYTGSDEVKFIDDQPHDVEINVYPTNTEVGVTKVKSLKSNAHHSFCAYYYDDAMRRSEPQVQVVDSTVYIPSIPEIGGLTGTNWQQYVSWQISNDAPSWAKYWRWGYAGNRSISQFWQYNVDSIGAGTGDWAAFTAVDISSLQTITDESAENTILHPDSNISSYVFEDGDRVKVLTQDSGTTYRTLAVADVTYDYEIKAFDDIGHIIYLDGAAINGGSSWAGYTGDKVVIEIYRPLKDPETAIFHEIGQVYEVYEDSGRYLHRGQTLDQVAGAAAEGVFDTGDVYLISRQLVNGITGFSAATDPIFVESYHWSDFYDSDAWGKGKVGIVTGIGQKYLDNIRFSNKYSPNTLSSGVSEFDFLDYKSLSSEAGKITAMRQAGHVLKVYFERNSASVMVNKTQITDVDGISQVVKSDQVLGSVEYSNYHYGTVFPESVLLIDRTIYFYDIYRKAYVRDASNGMFAISKYKAAKKFADVSEELLLSGVSNVQVWSAYDYERDFLYVMFYDSADTDNDDVLIFNEKRKRWETRVKMKENIQIGAYVRNEELDYRLTYIVETGITIASIDTTNNKVTFNNLPSLFEDTLKSPETDKEWLCLNLDTYSAAGYTRSGDYEDSLLITGYDTTTSSYTYTVPHGVDTNWSVSDQVVFINPFRFISYYNNNDSMIVASDISISYGVDYIANGPMFRKSDGTYVELIICNASDVTLDGAVSDLGGSPNEVRIPSTAHGLTVGDRVTITGTTNYNGNHFLTNINDVNTFDIEAAYVSETISSGTAIPSRNVVVPFTSSDPDTTWTSSDSILWDPKDFDPSYTNVWPSGNAVWLEDEDRWLIPVSQSDGSVISIGFIKFDEDFGNKVYYNDVIEDTDHAQGGYSPSLVLFEDEYYVFYTGRGGSNPDTSEWTLRLIKSSSYDDFSGSTAQTITTNTQLADGATGANQEKWYNSHIDGNTGFVWEDRLYVFVSGTSRYDISGNRSNRIAGLFEYNASTGSADVSRVGVVYPNMLDAAWPNSAWGADHIGVSITWVKDPINDLYISSFCQEPSGDSYEVGFGTFDFNLLFDEDDAVGFALPNAIGTSAQDLISFMGEDLYVHNNNESRGFFYNGLKKMVLNVIVNQTPGLTKVLDSITLNTNDGEWVVSNIEIPPTPSYPRGMTSKIPNAMLTKRENGLHADFLRNMKTSSTTESILELREGDELRGQTATITLENSESGEVVLFDILVNMSDSKI